jgi:flagellar motor switch/type III secretory pathway protein FliN
VTGQLRLAQATVRGDRLVGLGAGDVLQLPGTAPPRGESLSGQLRLGPLACRATLAADGATDRLTIESEVTIMDAPDRPDGIEALATGDLLERLPVVLAVELGRVELTAADVASLLPGAVIALDRPLGSLVDVLAGSRRIARGELVEVQGALAVRLTEVTL